MATAMVNGGPNTEVNPTSTTQNTGKQQQSRAATTSAQGMDTNRKQAGNANEAAQRRNAPPKAWTGMNPITQRSITPSQQNGAAPQPKSNTQRVAMNLDVNEQERSRQLHLLGTFMGHTATIKMRNGDRFSGIFFGASLEANECSYLMKMVQTLKPAGKGEFNGVKEDINSLVGVGADHAMAFEIKDVNDLSVEGLESGMRDKLQNGAATGFRTDADISGNLAIRERQLQRWAPSVGTDMDISLEDSTTSGEWDQFKANEKLFGLKTDYDENYYTTTIDRSNPSYREREARAQRIAREIESSSTNNAHAREERGHTDDGELDEEDKYSGVRRHGVDYPPLQSSQANRYMPPARRPPTGKPTVPGAPVDPAIISSQIARLDSSTQEQPTASSKAAATTAAIVKTDNATSPEVEQGSDSEAINPNIASSNDPQQIDASTAPTPNATTEEKPDVRDAFQKFAYHEKSRVVEERRKRVIQDKAIKLNDLKKFSTNFKLHTPVPKDLVPILAKDTAKQHEIVEKAQREAEQKAVMPAKTMASPGDKPASSKLDGTRAPPNTATTERSDHTHPRQGYPPRGPQASMTPRDKQQQFSSAFPPSPQNGQGMLSHRLADNHRQHKAGNPVSVPPPLPIHSAQKPSGKPQVNAGPIPSSQASSTVRTPTSAVSTKFNVNARDFRPNPAASTFKPTGVPSTTSSPKSNNNVRPASRIPTPSDFFGSKKPLPVEEKPSILEHFDPLKRLKEKAQKENKSKDYASNGGIVYAHATPVTWTQVDDDKNFKHYNDMFEAPPSVSRGASPQQSTVSPVNAALLHQLPVHLQQGSQGLSHVQATHQSQYQGPPQPQHYTNAPHHYEEHRMHPSPSTSSAIPTTRVQPQYLAYPPAMGQTMPYPNGQMHQYAITPNVAQHPNFRQFPGAPSFPHSPGQQFAAPMMVHNSSQGHYMGPQPIPGPPMHMYAQGQIPAYGGQSQPPSGYPSPGRGTPMMHQGSYQGQNAQVFMNGPQYGTPVYAPHPPQHSTPMRSYATPAQPHYNQSPQQQSHYPPQISRVPSNSYSHHPQGQYQHMQHPHPPMEAGDGK